MDADCFDALSRALTTARSRRTVVGALMGTLFAHVRPGVSRQGLAAAGNKDEKKQSRRRKNRKGSASRRHQSRQPGLNEVSETHDVVASTGGDEGVADEARVTSQGCRRPGARCRKGRQCCTGKCIRKRKCACATNTPCPAPADTCKETVCGATGACGVRNRPDGSLCASGKTCLGGSCSGNCVADCRDKACGDNGCGGSCGACLGGQTCNSGECQCPGGTELCYGTCIQASDPCCAATAAALQDALGPGGPETVSLCAGVTLKGLFVIRRNVTVIGAGSASTTLDGDGEPTVIAVSGAVTAAELRGVRITNRSYGVQNGGVLSLVDVKLEGTGKSWPAGILNEGDLTLIDSSVTGFSGDTGTLGSRVSDGGGIMNYPLASVTLRRSTIFGNKAFKGGGIYSLRGSVTLEEGSRISGNTSTFGGGFYQEGGVFTLKTGSRVENNTATGSSGGIDNLGGSVTLEDGSVVSGNTSQHNSGGIDNRGTLTLRAGSRVVNNTALGSNGGIGNFATATLEAGSRVTGNTAADRGGGIANTGTVTLAAEDIVTDNHLADGTTVNNCWPVDTIPHCIG